MGWNSSRSALRAPGSPNTSLTSEEVPNQQQSADRVEEYLHFWMVKPWRWRVERGVAPEPGEAWKERQGLVINGAVWWNWSRRDQVDTNARTARPDERKHDGVEVAPISIFCDCACCIAPDYSCPEDASRRATPALGRSTSRPTQTASSFPRRTRGTIRAVVSYACSRS
jgi:hypothetical protein